MFASHPEQSQTHNLTRTGEPLKYGLKKFERLSKDRWFELRKMWMLRLDLSFALFERTLAQQSLA